MPLRVEQLLERKEVNPDKPDGDSRTPLLCAASGGHEGVVKLLLEREEVNPDNLDIWGRTPSRMPLLVDMRGR